MKAFKVKYSHGHFIDIETHERLVPVQGKEYIITAKDDAFKGEDSKLKMSDALSGTEKENWARKKFGVGNHMKIMKAGEQLFFRIGNSRRVEGDEDHQYIFVCTLLEDLYLYLLKGKNGTEEEHWRLADCKCQLESCLLGGLTLTEKIPAKSLNSLFSQTVQFYFSLQRSAAVNAVTSFFFYKKGMSVTNHGALNSTYKGLADARKEFVAKRKK